MLKIYFSNDLDILKDLLSENIRRHINTSLFPKAKIIIPSNGIKEWLQINFLDTFCIFDKNNFLFIDTFFRILSYILITKSPINFLDKPNIFFILLSIIPKMLDNKELYIFNKYFNKNIEKNDNFINLCYQIANIYEQYLLYRIDWLIKWERGELVTQIRDVFHQKWQAKLWKAIVTSLPNSNKKIYFRHHMYLLLLEHLKILKYSKKLYELPNPIFIFNHFNIPNIYFNILRLLSSHIEIHYFQLNPCKNYWIEDYDYHWTTHPFNRIKTTPVSVSKLESNHNFYFICNNLLYKWGKIIKESIFHLLQIDTVEIHSFATPNPTNILNIIKKDILEAELKCFISPDAPQEKREYFFSEPITEKFKIRPIDIRDNSISINICSTIQHEVDVLYDYLIKLINENPKTIKPKNILVMVSDISLYAPAIQGKFIDPENQLPYNIYFLKNNIFKIYIKNFLKLLKLPKTEYTLEDVISILEISSIRKKFNISIEEIPLLYKWLKNSGIKKGLNKAHLRKLNISKINIEYTWEFILKRILLGYVANNNNINNIIPYYSEIGISDELIGNFNNFFMYINKWYLKLSLKYSFRAWYKIIKSIHKDFFYPFENNNIIKFNKLLYYAFALNKEFTSMGLFNVEVLIYYLDKFIKIEEDMLSIQHGINFCSMNHMRAIPFKVICMLGMNENLCSTINPPLAFDLIYRNSKKGDLYKGDENRSIFLETILATKDKLYISYVGNYILESTERYQGINELLEYIIENFYLVSYENNRIIINKKDIKSHFCFYHESNIYDYSNYIFDTKNHSKTILVPNDTITIKEEQLDKDIIIKRYSINWNQFLNFWKHPIREYWRLNFRINLYHLCKVKHNHKYIHPLDLYHIRKQIYLKYLNKDKRLDNLFCFYKQNRILPAGNAGILIWQEQKRLVLNLFNTISKYLITNELKYYEYNFDVYLNGIHLYGIVQNVTDNGLLKFKLSKLNYLDYLLLYIEHMFINYLIGAKYSIIYGIDNRMFVLSPITRSKAKDLLIHYFYGYFIGLKIPIFLPPITTSTFMQLISKSNYDIMNLNSSLYKSLKLDFKVIDRVWQGDNFSSGELYEDLYIKKTLNIDNNIYYDYIPILIKNIKMWFSPILSFAHKDS